MKRLFFILTGFLWSYAEGQNDYVLGNVFNLDLKFKMHQDSLRGLTRVDCPVKFFDSTFVMTGGRKVNLTKMGIYPTECKYNMRVETYLYEKYSTDSVLIFLDFYSKRLISYSVYFSSDSLKADVNDRVIKEFGKYQRKLSNTKQTIYFYRTRDPIFYTLTVSDTKAMHYMPSWCGNANRKYRRTKSWEKLNKYLLEK